MNPDRSNVTTADVTGGTVTMAGASAITGTLGAVGNALTLINAGAGADSVSGLVNATALDFNGTSTVSLNGVGMNNVGTIAFGADNGTLSLGAGGVNLTGNITATNTGTDNLRRGLGRDGYDRRCRQSGEHD